MLSFSGSERAAFKFIGQFFDGLLRKTKSGLEVLDPWPRYTWVDARFDNATGLALFLPPSGGILLGYVQGPFSGKSAKGRALVTGFSGRRRFRPPGNKEIK